MNIIGDRHYRTTPGEQITFSVGEQNQVGNVTISAPSAASHALPLTVGGGSHQTIAVTVGYTQNDGGSAVIEVSSNQSGSDSSRVRQIVGFGFRDAIFTID